MTQIARKLEPKGALHMLVMRGNPFGGRQAAHVLNVIKHGLPRPGLPREVNRYRWTNLPNLMRGTLRIWLSLLLHTPVHYGAVFHRVRRNGAWLEYGLASLRVVTDAGVADICSRMAGTSAANIANFKYHGFGTGTTAEAATQTALVTEETTQYASDNTRPTGSQATQGNVGNATYTTVGTHSPDSGGTRAITEHGIFNQAATGGGAMLDRSVFSAVNLVAGSDSLQTTYVFTLASGG
jgi:hypothetical protein